MTVMTMAMAESDHWFKRQAICHHIILTSYDEVLHAVTGVRCLAVIMFSSYRTSFYL